MASPSAVSCGGFVERPYHPRMAFTPHELTAHHAALQWFLARRRPPEHIRPQLDVGWAIVGHTVDLFEVRPDWRDPSVTRHRPFARIRYIRTQDRWRLHWMRASLKWQVYEPDPEHEDLLGALAVVHEDAFACFFG